MFQNSSTNNTPVTIYEPNHIQKAGILVWGEMVRELIALRGLIWRLIVRDISARYKQSFLGIFWAFLAPAVMMFVFVWVKVKTFFPLTTPPCPMPPLSFLGTWADGLAPFFAGNDHDLRQFRGRFKDRPRCIY